MAGNAWEAGAPPGGRLAACGLLGEPDGTCSTCGGAVLDVDSADGASSAPLSAADSAGGCAGRSAGRGAGPAGSGGRGVLGPRPGAGTSRLAGAGSFRGPARAARPGA